MKSELIPDWLPQSVWTEFKRHRQKIKAPMTEYAGSLILAKLERFKAQGANPIDVLNESIERGWAGVFLNGHGGKNVEISCAGPSNGAGAKSCKKCGSIKWVSLNRYSECEKCV